HGVDALRYFLIREIPWDSDGNFSFERFDARYESELADGYGNLASRVLAMIVKYLDGKLPKTSETTPLDQAGDTVIEEYVDSMDQHLLHLGAQAAWKLVARANQYVEESQPWALYKEGKTEELGTVLTSLARAIARVTLMASPFMPGKTNDVWASLGLSRTVQEAVWRDLEEPPVSGATVIKPPPLFPKVA
ncbi:MAG: class I tRNA ligase family protein, partial [Gemmatimonadota bacterium]|nr:class I tRNA ligase family protein [Gemmatimonadota bacterium]